MNEVKNNQNSTEQAVNYTDLLAGVSLAEKVIQVLDKKCRNGCNVEHDTWDGFQNGNGTECGADIERLIKQAKRLLKNNR